ncbi:hypothetical protein EV1_019939 [Malus domestica]
MSSNAFWREVSGRVLLVHASKVCIIDLHLHVVLGEPFPTTLSAFRHCPPPFFTPYSSLIFSLSPLLSKLSSKKFVLTFKICKSNPDESRWKRTNFKPNNQRYITLGEL